MQYSYKIMPEHRGKVENDEDPYFCVVKEYDLDDYEYNKFPNNTEYLQGKEFEDLTEAEAIKKMTEENEFLESQESQD